jgi:hypothetical protein
MSHLPGTKLTEGARSQRAPSQCSMQTTPNSTHRWLQPGGSDPSPDVDLSYASTGEKACCEKRRAKACVEDVPMSGLSYSDGGQRPIGTADCFGDVQRLWKAASSRHKALSRRGIGLGFTIPLEIRFRHLVRCPAPCQHAHGGGPIREVTSIWPC